MDITFTDKNGCNSLHIASTGGHAEFVTMLLRYWTRQKFLSRKRLKVKNERVLEFNINSMDDKHTTSLMKAALKNSADVV